MLQHDLWVMNYYGRSLPVYNISVPTQLLFAMPTDSAHSLSDVHILPPNKDDINSAVSCDMAIQAVMLESSWPDLARNSESTDMELVGEDAGSGSLESTSGLTMDVQSFDVEIIDLTGED